MRLLRLQIEGFGIFGDCSLPVDGEFPPGICVIAGPNEAGKSTLLAFVRRIIYGFPDARTKENQYPALFGGRHGGRMLVSDDQSKRIWIERLAGKKGGVVTVREEGGGELPATTIAGLVGHLPAEVFGSVFAFDLAALAGLGALDQEELRDRLYSAGAGATVSPAKVAKEIEDRLGELLKPRAGKARINDTVAKLTTKRTELESIGDTQAIYERVCAELVDAEQESVRLSTAAEVKRRTLLRTDRLIEARRHFVEFRAAEDELTRVGDQPFLTSGQARYSAMKEKLEDANRDLEELEQELREGEDELAEIELDEKLLEWSDPIDSLGRDLGKFESALEDLPKREAELEEAEATLRDGLRDLGPDWTEGKLRDFDLSIPFREQIRDWKRREEQARARLSDARTWEQGTEDAVAAARAAHDAANEVIQALAEPTAREGMTERRQAVRQLRAGATDLRLAEQEVSSLEERLRDKEAERQSLAQTSGGLPVLPRWPVLLFALAGLLGAGVTASYQRALWAILPIALGLLLASAYHSLRVWVSRLQQRTVEVRDDHLARADAVARELRSKETAAGNAKTDLLASLQQPLARLGLSVIPSAVEIERIGAELDEEQRQADEWDRAQADLVATRRRLEQAEQHLGKAVDTREKAVAACKSCDQDWGAWLQEASLPISLSTDGVLEFLTRAESARSSLRRIDDLRRRVKGIRGIMDEYVGRVSMVLEGCGRSENANASAADRLVNALAAAREASGHKRNLEGQLRRLRDRRSSLTERITGLGKERDKLFAAAMAKDEGEFLEAAARAERRAGLDKQRDEAKKLLENLLGSGAALSEALQELERTSPGAMEANAVGLREDVEKLQGEAQEADHRVGELRQQARGLETDERASRVRAEVRSLAEDILDDGEQWAVLAIAQSILRRTQDKYERERRPKVIEEAEGFFGEMTGNRYRLVSPAGETRLELELGDGKRKVLEQLSRATAEQLYLSLRFGYIRELARQSQSLPVVMDDVLVNFDPQRARCAARGLARMAQSHQVLFFTCHPETVALLREVVPEALVCQLSGP